MKELISKWFGWLQSATDKKDDRLAHVYSDGKQIWASDGYSLLALDVATEKNGHVTVNEDGLFQVDETGDIPPFATAMPQGEPIASVVMSAARLKQAVEGQEGMVRLSVYGRDQALELSSAGKYALVMPVTDVAEWQFWQPKSSDRN
ncbi:MAG TPA: hypothetical protein EYH05_06185 [Anaerolineae bacterium]|nr:hypothetical protein [Anaerolineae bacterium]